MQAVPTAMLSHLGRMVRGAVYGRICTLRAARAAAAGGRRRSAVTADMTHEDHGQDGDGLNRAEWGKAR